MPSKHFYSSIASAFLLRHPTFLLVAASSSWSDESSRLLGQRLFTLNTAAISSFGLHHHSVEVPSLSKSEVLHIQELLRRLPKNHSSHTTNDNDDDAPLLNNNPVQIIDALLLLRSKLWRREAIDATLQGIFNRCFANDQFVVERIDHDESKTDLLIHVLARDRVHPMVIHHHIHDNNETNYGSQMLHQLRMDETKHVYGLMHSWSGLPCMLLRISLGTDIPSCLDQIFFENVSSNDPTTTTSPTSKRNVATFFSITLLESGLGGLGLGERFLHDVMGRLQQNHGVDTFVTLSPMPRFRDWLNDEHQNVRETTTELERNYKLLQDKAFQYIAFAKDDRGLPYDPVARFHLSNGAQLYRINQHPSNLQDSYGCMVNYLYDIPRLQERKESFPVQLAIHEELPPEKTA